MTSASQRRTGADLQPDAVFDLGFVEPFEVFYRRELPALVAFARALSGSASAIAHAPLIYQLHATAAWVIWALWPFSRLVHAWSYPLWYLWRPYIVYRRRKATHPAEPGTGGRKWRKIGVPY